jgi:hypothetical protein
VHPRPVGIGRRLPACDRPIAHTLVGFVPSLGISHLRLQASVVALGQKPVDHFGEERNAEPNMQK